jgi:hypothetical protein
LELEVIKRTQNAIGDIVCPMEYRGQLHYDGCDTKGPPVLALKG